MRTTLIRLNSCGALSVKQDGDAVFSVDVDDSISYQTVELAKIQLNSINMKPAKMAI